MSAAPGAAPSYRSSAASVESSRKGEPGSQRRSTRSRGSSLPRAVCRSRALSPPPPAARASRSRSSPTRRRCSASLRSNSALPGWAWEVSPALMLAISRSAQSQRTRYGCFFAPRSWAALARQRDQGLATVDPVADRDQDLGDLAVARALDRELHLHRLEHDQDLAFLHARSGLRAHVDH